jgi:hypothetical protein
MAGNQYHSIFKQELAELTIYLSILVLGDECMRV